MVSFNLCGSNLVPTFIFCFFVCQKIKIKIKIKSSSHFCQKLGSKLGKSEFKHAKYTSEGLINFGMFAIATKAISVNAYQSTWYNLYAE
jgi:hypothetical protein